MNKNKEYNQIPEDDFIEEITQECPRLELNYSTYILYNKKRVSKEFRMY